MKLQDRLEKARNSSQGIGNSRPRLAKQVLVSVLSLGLLFATCPQALPAYQDAQSNPPPPAQGPPQGPARTPLSPEQLQQLVAPIALYPDSLVAQILAASTFPEQVVEADRWVQANPNLKGDDLAKAVDQQNWDPSVKALVAFPSVLANMDKNISWTSSLGDAYYNQEQDVMDAIQVMRQKAEEAGNLKTTPQQVVTTQGSTIVIQPANPTVVYVPAYNPWVIYGGPIVPWPRWYPVPGIWWGGPFISWGFGFGVGFFGGYGWGWPRWGFDWGRRVVVFNHNTYISRSTTFTTAITSTAEDRAEFIAIPALRTDPSMETLGLLYQKDLGERTADLVKAMTEYDPDSTWQKAEQQPEQSAKEPRN